KLIILPSAPQPKLIIEDNEVLDYETGTGVHVRDHKSHAERMSKEQWECGGMKRITAYCIAGSFKMKFLSSFLKCEHNLAPRVFDEALYV
ncbi:hypothetical protein GYMLUDRAFT_108638, partial [Collybiopsis luxurians FD-317 M1]